MKTTILALMAVLPHLLNVEIKAGELKLSLAQAEFAKFGGGTEFAKFSKLTLSPAPSEFRQKPEREHLSLGIPGKTNAPASLPDRQVSFLFQPPERNYFSKLYYVHTDWRVGGDTAGVDCFGGLWKSPSSKTEMVFPYFRWDYPSRREERVLAGVMFSLDF